MVLLVLLFLALLLFKKCNWPTCLFSAAVAPRARLLLLLSSLPLLLVLGVPLESGVALGIFPFFSAALPMRLMLGENLASCEAPMILFLLLAVLLLVRVLLGGVALESGVAWHCPFCSCCLPYCHCHFCCRARPWCKARTARHTGLEIIIMHGKYYK
jgi:hypothetical protein